MFADPIQDRTSACWTRPRGAVADQATLPVRIRRQNASRAKDVGGLAYLVTASTTRLDLLLRGRAKGSVKGGEAHLLLGIS